MLLLLWFRKITTIVSGIVSVVDVLKHHNYTIPYYPVKQVDLIHVKLIGLHKLSNMQVDYLLNFVYIHNQKH